MLKLVKFGTIAVGLGVVTGVGIGGWLYLHRADSAIATRAGSIALGPNQEPLASPASPNSTPSSDTSQNLEVIDQSQGAVLGDQQQGNAVATPTPIPTLPGPSAFGPYDKYMNNSTALYVDTVVGTGAAVAKGSQVTVNYRGWLTNGTEFDESYSRGKPFTFTEGGQGVIQGWQEGIFGMKVGGKRRILVPPALGYGASAPPPIPANALLVFDVELLNVQ